MGSRFLILSDAWYGKWILDAKPLKATFCYMSSVIRISEKLAQEARIRSNLERRSMTAQIEYWAMIGKAAEENPDLPFSFIRESLLAIEEMRQKGAEEYVFG
jgi:hypothetical protein